MANRKHIIPLSRWRQLSQAVCLLLFLFLFSKTDYTGSDQLEYAVNIIFRFDPLIATAVMLAAKSVVLLLLPALILVALSLLLGRFFCGWACPLGTLIDLVHPLLKSHNPALDTRFPRLRYGILAFLLSAAFFGLPLVGYLDPFSLLVRGLTLAVEPAINHAATSFFTFTYQKAPALVNLVTEPLYDFLQATILPFSQKHYHLVYLSMAILATVFLLELNQRRFFCRNLCPLGALLGLLARFGLMNGAGGNDACGRCTTCRNICRMGAIDEQRHIDMAACTLCLECLDKCPRSTIIFNWKKPLTLQTGYSGSRRFFLGSLTAGALLPLFTNVRGLAKVTNQRLIRPPGALGEKEFLSLCVRCGECMKVCIGNTLQPVFLEAGIEGMFSPKVDSRLGYCEFNCTLCGQVCPTGAIRELQLTEKHTFKIGQAFFDKNRCLPYARGIPCMVCEEHCPTADKAIKFNETMATNDRGQQVQVKQPFVVAELCIGCGICEHKCPLPGAAAIRITNAGETRSPDKALPVASAGYG
ncbi:MAG: 4Fe-4S binding protein [Deltaproteobacteria bacterium]|nr:4Fe-4S binding protein [Candidatus Anaeroferrophillus wilburensis]MBN2888616.1 4Fe-4S binding protein [Deltaproteobacteria bacterium]